MGGAYFEEGWWSGTIASLDASWGAGAGHRVFGGAYWVEHSEDTVEPWGEGHWWWGEENWYWHGGGKGGLEPGTDGQTRWKFVPKPDPEPN